MSNISEKNKVVPRKANWKTKESVGISLNLLILKLN